MIGLLSSFKKELFKARAMQRASLRKVPTTMPMHKAIMMSSVFSQRQSLFTIQSLRLWYFSLGYCKVSYIDIFIQIYCQKLSCSYNINFIHYKSPPAETHDSPDAMLPTKYALKIYLMPIIMSICLKALIACQTFWAEMISFQSSVPRRHELPHF